VSLLADRLLAVHRALDAAALPHAFGGAIASRTALPNHAEPAIST
jgi:hypothetical protein